MSERARESSLSQAVRALIAQLPRWESRMAAWPQVVSERLAVALKTAQDEAEARQQSEARAWAQERATWHQAMQHQLQSLTALTERQGRLIARYEAEAAPWVLTWSRDRWQQVAANVTVTLGVSLLLLALFWWLAHVGLALALGIAATVNAILLIRGLLRRADYAPTRALWRTLLASAVASAVMIMSIPIMVTAPFMLWAFCLKLHWVPCSGWGGFFDSRIVIPAIVMGVPGIAQAVANEVASQHGDHDRPTADEAPASRRSAVGTDQHRRSLRQLKNEVAAARLLRG